MTGVPGETDLDVILASLHVLRHPDPVTMIGWDEAAAAPPATGDGVLAVVAEDEGPSVVATIERAERSGWQHEFSATWLTIGVHSSLNAVGLTAAMAQVLTAHDIPCNVIAGFRHDHLLVPLERTDEAIVALESLAARPAEPDAPPGSSSQSDSQGDLPFAHKPTLTGESVALRPMVASDADHMWADLHDREAMRLTGSHGEFERTQIDAWCASRAEQSDRLDLAVTDRSDGHWLGEVVINQWDPDNSSCSFRIALAEHARDRGVGTEATRLIVDYVFDHVGVNRVELEVFAFNPRAVAVYEKVGFVREGVRRQALRWDGAFVDAVVMSIVASDR